MRLGKILRIDRPEADNRLWLELNLKYFHFLLFGASWFFFILPAWCGIGKHSCMDFDGFRLRHVAVWGNDVYGSPI